MEPSRHGLSADHSVPANSDKSGNPTETTKLPINLREFGTIAASPSIIEDHTKRAGNENLADIQYRVMVRPGAPLTVARKPSESAAQ